MKTIYLSVASLFVVATVTFTACDQVVIETEAVYAERLSESDIEPAPVVLAQAAAVEPKVDKPAGTVPDKEKSEPKSTDANPTAATRPKADRTPRKAGEPIRISFDHIILGMQKDMVYRPWMLNDDVKDLDGQKVSISGIMHDIYEGGTGGKPIKWFVLLRNKECKYGPGGQADHLAEVELKPGTPLKYTHETVRVEGTLKIVPKTGKDGNTWSLYVLEDATAKVQ